MKVVMMFAVAALGMMQSSVAMAQPIRDVVLVHGAFADGSGWRKVFDRLTAKGFRVRVVQAPGTSLEDDVAAAKRIIDQVDGDVVLVGHSWGGQVITEAGADPKVKSLVYVAAVVPKAGESLINLTSKPEFPSPNNDVKKTPDGFLYVDPPKFHADFMADSPKAEADFMAVAQVLVSADAAFGAPAKAAAWESKPSWAIVAGADKMINPDLERWMYKRAKSKVTEVPGAAHAVFLSHPDQVAAVIEQAAGK